MRLLVAVGHRVVAFQFFYVSITTTAGHLRLKFLFSPDKDSGSSRPRLAHKRLPLAARVERIRLLRGRIYQVVHIFFIGHELLVQFVVGGELPQHVCFNARHPHHVLKYCA